MLICPGHLNNTVLNLFGFIHLVIQAAPNDHSNLKILCSCMSTFAFQK